MKVIHFNQEENEIIRLAIDNNRSAQQKIYAKFSSKILSVCRQYIKDIHQAEDIMITAFMKVFSNLKNFEKKEVLKVGFDGLWSTNVFRILGFKKKLVFWKKNITLRTVSITLKVNFLSKIFSF